MEFERSHAATSFGRAWFALTVAFALHVFDEATTGFLTVYNPTVTAMRARWEWFPMPTFEFREWLVGLILAVALCFAHSAPIPRRALDAAAGLALCCDSVFQRDGTHHRNDSGPHGGIGDVSASGAGILFFAVSLPRVGVADGSSAPDARRN